LNGIFVHLYVKALLQPTGLTLIAPRHINRAVASFLALVRQIAANASLEESTTTVACEHTVMFPGRSVSADSAQNNRFAIYSLHGVLCFQRQLKGRTFHERFWSSLRDNTSLFQSAREAAEVFKRFPQVNEQVELNLSTAMKMNRCACVAER